MFIVVLFYNVFNVWWFNRTLSIYEWFDVYYIIDKVSYEYFVQYLI